MRIALRERLKVRDVGGHSAQPSEELLACHRYAHAYSLNNLCTRLSVRPLKINDRQMDFSRSDSIRQ